MESSQNSEHNLNDIPHTTLASLADGDHAFVTSIQGRQCVEISYKDEIRIIEPYTLGTSKKDKRSLSAFQLSGDRPGWRLFHVDQITEVRSLEDQFDLRDGYKRGDSRMAHIEVEA